jgi:hypothetical protein
MTLPQLLITAAAVYAGIGAAFAMAFILRGAATIDPVASHAGWGFRLLILPGSVALWPLLLFKWRGAHRVVSRREPGP